MYYIFLSIILKIETMDEKLYNVKVLMDTSLCPNRDYETVLEAVARKIPPEGIYCINFDSEYAVYELYLPKILDIITLLRDGIEIYGVKIPVCPSYDAFLVSGVYPFIENSTLCELFSKFGNVTRISDIHVSPDTPKFSHIKSGFRQVELSSRGREENVCLPSIITAVIEGFSVLFTIRKLCYICMNLGHDTVKCPGLRTGNLTKIKYTLPADNEIVSFDDFNSVFKEDIDDERMTVTNDEKSDEGYKYLSVQSPGRLTASSSSALHSSSDMLLTGDKHYGNGSCDNSDKLKNMNIYRGKKRKHSSSSTSTNDQNSSEVSNVACLNIRNEEIISNVSLNPKNCLSLSVSDDSGWQFKKLYSVNYCARCKEELEIVGNNHLPQPNDNKQCDSFVEIASNKVSENVLSEIHVKNFGLEVESAENLSTVPLSFNESYELQNPSSNVIVDVISHLDDDIYVRKEEGIPKNNNELKIIDIHCVRKDHTILPENTKELKSSDVRTIKKVNESFLKNTDEFGTTIKLNVVQSKEEILSYQSSLGNQTSSNVTDARPSGSVNEEIDYSAVINPANDISFSNPHSVDHAYDTEVPKISYGDQLNNADLIGKSHQIQLGRNKHRDHVSWKNIDKLSRYDNVNTVPLSINESYEPVKQSSNLNSDVISCSDDNIYIGEQENFLKSSNELKIVGVHSVGEDQKNLSKNINELKISDVLSIKNIHECFLENNGELESTNRFNIGQSREKILSFESSLSIRSSNVTDGSPSACTNEVVDYSAVKNLTNNVSFSKHSVDHAYNIEVPEISYGDQLNNADLTDKSHQIQPSDNNNWDPLPWKNIDEQSRNDTDESSICSSTSLPSVEELLKLS